MIRHIDEKTCIGCGVCEVVCPADVIRMDSTSGKARMVYPKDCWTCYNCETDCPVDAIDVSPFAKLKPQPW